MVDDDNLRMSEVPPALNSLFNRALFAACFNKSLTLAGLPKAVGWRVVEESLSLITYHITPGHTVNVAKCHTQDKALWSLNGQYLRDTMNTVHNR